MLAFSPNSQSSHSVAAILEFDNFLFQIFAFFSHRLSFSWMTQKHPDWLKHIHRNFYTCKVVSDKAPASSLWRHIRQHYEANPLVEPTVSKSFMTLLSPSSLIVTWWSVINDDVDYAIESDFGHELLFLTLSTLTCLLVPYGKLN